MNRSVRHHMSSAPDFIRPEDSLQEAMKTMTTSKVSHLPVVDEVYELKGVVSKEDVLTKLNDLIQHSSEGISTAKMIGETKVSEIMTSDAIVVQVDDSIDLAVEILLQREFHCVPVVDQGILVGILTSFDLLKGYYDQFG